MNKSVLGLPFSDNPVLCRSDFYSTVEMMEVNATKIHGDYSICPPTTEETVTTPVSTAIPTAAVTTASSIDKVNAVNYVPKLRVNQPEPLPLLFVSRHHDKPLTEGENQTEAAEEVKNEKIVTTERAPVKSESQNIVSKDVLTYPENNLLPTVVINPPAVDEGRNETNSTKIENGVAGGDTEEHLVMKSQVQAQNESMVSSSLKNAEPSKELSTQNNETKEMPND